LERAGRSDEDAARLKLGEQLRHLCLGHRGSQATRAASTGHAQGNRCARVGSAESWAREPDQARLSRALATAILAAGIAGPAGVNLPLADDQRVVADPPIVRA